MRLLLQTVIFVVVDLWIFLIDWLFLVYWKVKNVDQCFLKSETTSSMAPKSNKLNLLVFISWTTDQSICHRSKSWPAASRPCGGDQFPVQCQSSRCLVQIVHPRRNHRSWLPVGSAAGSHHIRCSGKHVCSLTTSRVKSKVQKCKDNYDRMCQKLKILKKSTEHFITESDHMAWT